MAKILAAFDKCKDSLAAKELCLIVKKIVEQAGRSNSVEMMPLTDGGEGFSEILTEKAEGKLSLVLASDSIGRTKEIGFGLCELEKLPDSVRELLQLPEKGRIAIVEMAKVVGLSDLSLSERNAWKTSTAGIGEVFKHLSTLNLDSILLGIGGSSTNDMGIGALNRLGMEMFSNSGKVLEFPSPENWNLLARLSRNKMVSLPAIKIACDVKNPLLGPNGATYQFGGQKGLSLEDRHSLEDQMNKMVLKLSELFPNAEKAASLEGSGAAGGIGYGLSLVYDVSMVGGFDLISNWFQMENKIIDSDLVITGEGRFDRTSLEGKGPFELIRTASDHGKKAYVFAGSVEPEAKKICQQRFPDVEIHQFGNPNLDLEQTLARAEEFLAGKIKEVQFD